MGGYKRVTLNFTSENHTLQRINAEVRMRRDQPRVGRAVVDDHERDDDLLSKCYHSGHQCFRWDIGIGLVDVQNTKHHSLQIRDFSSKQPRSVLEGSLTGDKTAFRLYTHAVLCTPSKPVATKKLNY